MRRYWNDAETMQKLGKAFGDMPGITGMFAGAGAVEGAGETAGEEDADADTPDSEFLNAAMEGDVDAIKKAIADNAAGARPARLCVGHWPLGPPLLLFLVPVAAHPPPSIAGMIDLWAIALGADVVLVKAGSVSIRLVA